MRIIGECGLSDGGESSRRVHQPRSSRRTGIGPSNRRGPKPVIVSAKAPKSSGDARNLRSHNENRCLNPAVLRIGNATRARTDDDGSRGRRARVRPSAPSRAPGPAPSGSPPRSPRALRSTSRREVNSPRRATAGTGKGPRRIDRGPSRRRPCPHPRSAERGSGATRSARAIARRTTPIAPGCPRVCS